MSSDVEALLGLAPLEVGQRVRIRLGGECRTWYPPIDCFGRVEPGFWAEHSLEADGLTGTVVDIYPNEECGHVYEVRGDRYWTHRDGEAAWPINGDHFARAELERLP